jgi:hypothetical protein
MKIMSELKKLYLYVVNMFKHVEIFKDVDN